MGCGIFDRPFLHFGDARRHRNDNTWRYQFPMMDLLDEVAQHRFGDLEVGDDTILHGPNGHDIPGRASQHPFGFFAYGQDVGRPCLDRHDRGLSQNDASIPYVHEGIGRPEVNPNVVGEQAF